MIRPIELHLHDPLKTKSQSKAGTSVGRLILFLKSAKSGMSARDNVSALRTPEREFSVTLVSGFKQCHRRLQR